MNPAIVFDDVVPPAADAAEPLTFEVPEGAFYVVATGAARTGVLPRLCAGLARPVAGRVEVLGIEPARLDRRALLRFRRALGVGLLPDGLVSNLTLRMNLTVPLLYSGAADSDEAARLTAEMLEASGLAGWADLRPADVPVDARRAAVIARAIARGPRLLLLEEPIRSLPEPTAEMLLALCRERAHTVVVTSAAPAAILHTVADHAATWDEHGLRPSAYEVGAH